MTQPMKQQQPFEQKGPAVTKIVTYGDKHMAEMRAMDNSGCRKPKEHERWNRFEKMDFVNETTAITQTQVLEELVSWMPEEMFSQFYEDFCSNWDICRSYKELNEKYPD